MSYQARVFRILIASPSDVTEERDLVVQCIQEWNDLHSADRKVVLLPLRWETHSRPEFGKRPQEIINTTVVDHCDLLIGIFWTRIGTDTGVSKSGTIEEIERVAKSGLPVMLYFSKNKVEPERIEVEQLSKLNEFKKQTYSNALVEHYLNTVDFRDKLSRHLEMKVRELMSEAVSGDGSVDGGQTLADLDIQLADITDNNRLGRECEIQGEYIRLDDYDLIQDFIKPKDQGNDDENDFIRHVPANKNYYRDIALKLLQKSLFRPVRLSLENIGIIGVRDIYIDLDLVSDEKFFFISQGMMIDEISPYFGPWNEGERVEHKRILSKSSRWNTSIELPAIQPKRVIYPDTIGYIGSPSNATIELTAKVYGDCFPDPKVKTVNINFVSMDTGKSIKEMVDNYLSKLTEKKGTAIRRRRTK